MLKQRFTLHLLLPCVLLVSGGRCFASSQASAVLLSPDARIRVTVMADPFTYSVHFREKQVVEPSALGLDLQASAPLRGLQITKAERRSEDMLWHPVWGKNSTVRNRYNELLLTLKESSPAARTVELIVRAYPDGVAFRYILPEQTGVHQFTVARELTTFRFSGNPDVWAASYKDFRSAYEEEYPKRPLSALPKDGLIGLPLVAKLTDAYAAVLEADLTDWAGLYLRPDTDGLHASLSPRQDGRGLVVAKAPHASPWRVLVLGATPGDLIESNLIENLNPRNKIEDTSWIRPGKMMWDHWWSGNVKMDRATNERFIQFASTMGFPYQLIDWQWYGPYNKPTADLTQPAPALELDQLLRFAKDRGVREWLWLHSGDVDRSLAAGRLDDVFALYERWGIAGVKIDFMNSDDQDRVNWYLQVVELAAKHHLMVDYHGAFKPTGMEVTWPNLLTREAVLGNEYNKFSARVTPTHKLTLPFTRMLAGPMDFTPGGFRNRSPVEWKATTPTEVMGSRAQELAMLVVYWSPLACLADDPEQYEGQPGLDFLRAVPTTWDETRVLDGAIGEHVVIARRKGQDWFLGGMSSDRGYQLQLPLTFLRQGSYRAHIFADPLDPSAAYTALEQSTRLVSSSDTLTLSMRSAGGVAVRFERLR